MEPPEDDEPAMQWILDTITGADDTCAPISSNCAKFHSNVRHLGSKCAAPCRLTIPTEACTHIFPFLVRQPSDPIRADWHRLHIWRDDLLNGWLKSSSDLSGSLTASAFQHKGRNRRGIGPWIASLSMCPAQPLEEHV
jgi:hypothetical protein